MLNKLTAIAVKKAKPGRHADGGGLYLEKTETNSKWIYRYSFAGRRRDMGLGRLSDVTLAQARSERDRWAACIARGVDPISERDRLRGEALAEIDQADPTVEELVMTVYDARKATFKDPNDVRWLSPFNVHILPRIGKRKASSVTAQDLVRVLSPIWKSKPDVSKKAIQRLRIVWTKGRVMGFNVDPIVIERVRETLGAIDHQQRHVASTSWQEIPALFDRLGEVQSSGRMCLQFVLLTAVRSQSARGARFSEIEGNVWTVPPERVKSTKNRAKEFRVPLSSQALELVERARALSNDPINGLLFESPEKQNHPLSQNALVNVLNDMGEAGRPHGMRTSFRTWVQDTEAATFEVAETALGHVVGGRVERSYARSDLLDLRASLMQRWADYVTGRDAKVVPIRAGAS
ncbi:hypothetical protein BMI86_00025 [Thioclava sp. DLFJ5-1]|uniref:tyrosine-type recombinase/integrase n=1 Tax=Thioclava sp. DLFJ5-1 TaxID=1915314 RepID=UPI0009979C65|nr:site-specific integrase [Thioclava sp. DLFJ5-1]OOY21022.1 hypothetical protein BMI86_00025 [Thioclava sp. DLFJ5-1]